MGTPSLTRLTSGLVLRDDFGSDTSANYYIESGDTLGVTSGYLYAVTNTADKAVTDQDKTARVVTVRGWRNGTGKAGSYACLFNASSPTWATRSGYMVSLAGAATKYSLERMDNGADTELAAGTNDLPATGDVLYYYSRIWHENSDIRAWAGRTFPLQNSFTSTDATYNNTTLYNGGRMQAGTGRFEYFECRTDYRITCIGLPAGYKLQANGSASYRATEVRGKASLDVAVLDWPLTSVEVLDPSNTQIVQLTTSTYTDMGGGDIFSYDPDWPSGIRHAFTVSVADVTTTGLVHPADWLADHTIAAGTVLRGFAPIGSVLPFAGALASLPSGWLLCDGTSYLRTGSYADLFTAISTIYGSADGTHFNVPDLRDKFIVGAKQDDTSVPKSNIRGSLEQSATIPAATMTHGMTVADHTGLTHAGLAIADHTITHPIAIADHPTLSLTISIAAQGTAGRTGTKTASGAVTDGAHTKTDPTMAARAHVITQPDHTVSHAITQPTTDHGSAGTVTHGVTAPSDHTMTPVPAFLALGYIIRYL